MKSHKGNTKWKLNFREISRISTQIQRKRKEIKLGMMNAKVQMSIAHIKFLAHVALKKKKFLAHDVARHASMFLTKIES